MQPPPPRPTSAPPSPADAGQDSAPSDYVRLEADLAVPPPSPGPGEAGRPLAFGSADVVTVPCGPQCHLQQRADVEGTAPRLFVSADALIAEAQALASTGVSVPAAALAEALARLLGRAPPP